MEFAKTSGDVVEADAHHPGKAWRLRRRPHHGGGPRRRQLIVYRRQLASQRARDGPDDNEYSRLPGTRSDLDVGVGPETRQFDVSAVPHRHEHGDRPLQGDTDQAISHCH